MAESGKARAAARFVAALRGPDGARALGVALIVGTALNLINQGEVFFAHQTMNLWKLGLTYLVPFFVSLHGAVFSRGAGGA
jgi:hypothetical protein